VATTIRLLKTMVTIAGVPLTDAVKMLTMTPARIMNVLETKGELTTGKDADIVIFDEGFNIQKTMVQGRIVYSRE
jgi:N-acetylglucosamine-6-phosphate deacetylase